SGVVALLEAARRLSLARPGRSVLFLAFAGEEHGLLGSAAYVKTPAVPNDSLVAMLNFDMVGRLRENRLVVYGVETAKEWRPLLDSLNASAGFSMAAQGDGYGPSDHTSFTVAKRPVLHFFTGTHEDYHRTSDDWQKINLAGVEKIAEFAANIARATGSGAATLTFVDLPPPAPSTSGRGGGYGAYLGTIPDMTDNPGGVRLSGARGGSPAEKAGLKAGDILVKLGTHDVPDLQGMTDALRSYQPGDEVDVVVIRDGQRQTFKVTLGRRGGS
ncbi:MAG TPA: M28 family peptidase, partial [Gemmatimonadales bacterium]